MKFNENLIELRKKQGISQEELGDKLNVTRQTVSKWELGLTKPDIDKLAEMSKIFGVTVDELINENQGYNGINENQSIQEQSQTKENENSSEKNIEDQPIIPKKEKSNNKRSVIIVSIIVVLMFLCVFGMIFTIGKKMVSTKNKYQSLNGDDSNPMFVFFDTFFDIADHVLERYDKNTNEIESTYNNDNIKQQKLFEEYNEKVKEMEEQFNSSAY